MALSRTRRLGASILLSLIMVAGTGSMAWGADPSQAPSETPTAVTTPAPSVDPTSTPTPVVTPTPTPAPSATPSATPSDAPIPTPSVAPTAPPESVPPTQPHDKTECTPPGLRPQTPARDCVGNAIQPSGPKPAATTASSGAIVSGTITAGGAPANHILVALADPTYGFGGTLYGLSTYTDSSGGYWISGVNDGTYTLLVMTGTQDYLWGYYDSAANTTGYLTTDQTQASVLTVSGADILGKDMALQKGFDIKGKLSGAGSAVISHGVVWVSTPVGYQASVSTDSAGNYSIPVPAGDVTLFTRDESAAFVSGYYNNSTTGHWSATSPSTLAMSADRTGVNVTLPIGVYIRGTILGTGGTPMPNVVVRVTGNYYWASTTTASNGSYSLDVPTTADDFDIFIYTNYGLYFYGYYCSTCTGHLTEDVSSDTPLSMAGSTRLGINMTLDTGYFITGKVVDKDSKPLAGLNVSAVPQLGGGYYTEGQTAADGTFMLDVESDGYVLYIQDPSGLHVSGYYRGTVASKFTANWNMATTVTMVKANVAVGTIQLPAGYQITGKVIRSGGLPLANIYVVVSDGNGYDANTYTVGNGTFVTTMPAAAGSYQFDFQDQNGVYLTCWYDGTSTCTSVRFDAVDVSVTGNTALGTISMTKGNHITGLVTDSATGDPIPFIPIDAYSTSTDYDYSSQSSDDGTYDILVPPGSYDVQFTDWNGTYVSGWYDTSVATTNLSFDPASTSAVSVGPDPIPADDASDINVQMGTGYTISGHLTDSTGADLWHTVYVTADHVNISGYTDDSGDYSILVPPGEYTVSTVEDGRYVAGYYCSSCGSGHFTLSAPAATLVDATGANATGIDMVVLATPSQPLDVVAIAADGQALVTWATPADDGGLPITDYTVTAFDTTALTATPYDAGMSLSYTASGLTNGDSYIFSVAATNDGGKGVSSDSVHVTPHALSTFFPMAPTRLLDTRYANGHSGKLTAGVPVAVQITGRLDHTPTIPDGATAITVNVTAVNESVTSSLYIGPDAVAHPATSTINFKKGDTTAYGSTVSLSGNGYAYMTVAGGTTDLVLDVTGYFMPGASGSTYYPLTPTRLLDSRVKNGLSGKFKPGVPRQLTIRGRGGVPTGATAITGNLTVTNTTGNYAAYIGPAAIAKPSSSTINFAKGQTRANSLTVSLSSSGTVWITYMGSGTSTIDVVFDVTGYYTAAGDTSGQSYVPLTPNALLDTRVANGHTGKVSANTPTAFTIWGRGNVPSTATGITGIVSVFNQTANWAVFVGPDPVALPLVSNLNFNKGDNCSNGLTVALSAAGQLNVTYMGPAGAMTDVVLVVTGYFVATP